jgi:hypothetical protein
MISEALDPDPCIRRYFATSLKYSCARFTVNALYYRVSVTMIIGNYDTMPEDVTITFCFGAPDSVPTASMAFTTSIPSTTSPNTTCRSSSHFVTAVVMKNYSRIASLAQHFRCINKVTYLRTICVGTSVGHREQPRLMVL